MSEWRPIETAPKDGSFVLLLCPLTFPKYGHAELPFPGRWVNGAWAIVNRDSALQRAEPLDWMPLPARHGDKG